ncbi:SCO7613 C-terminal domain-containing membrane protein [Krasilnikovia sp. MM14-A1259]|uniref:SCO7613 C-terminal domain-containing membrane protein n=1 Tax=Krasilnikovia sp. MM14-A1259 TaxID=3373539 RepID=UPI003812DBEA
MISYPCPFCSVPADAAVGCPGCGRGPDLDAVEVVRLDGQIRVLNQRLAATDTELRETWRLREAAAARVRATVASARIPSLASVPAAPAPVAAAAVSGPAPARAEASGKLVQNVLFLLGGLLLGVAAIVFTAVAWAQFGVGGRAALLATFTAAALAVPPVALRRGLTATAETFAGVGLLLVLLDGYAAWYVDLFGVARYSALGYAGAVCAVTAAVAAGYEHVTGLVGPRFVALLVAQPVLPLLVAPLHPDATGWAFTLAGTAVLNLAVVYLRGACTALVLTAYALGAALLAASSVAALVGLAVATSVLPGAAAAAALVTASAVAVVGAVVSRSTVARTVTGGLLVVALGLGGAWVATFAVAQALAAVAAVAAVLAAGVAVGTRYLPAWIRRGPWAGAVVVVAVPSVIAAGQAIAAAGATLTLAQPVFVAPVAVVGGDRWLAVALVLLAAGAAVLAPRGVRAAAAVVGGVLVAFAAPAALRLPWWSAPGFDLAAAAAALAVALRAGRSRQHAARHLAARIAAFVNATGRGVVRRGVAGVAVVPVWHAVAVGFGRPGVAAATFGAVLALGVAGAAGAGTRRDIGGVSLAVGLLAVPAIGGTGAAAAGLPATAQARAVLAGAVLLVAVRHLVAARWPGYGAPARTAALLAAVCAPVAAAASGDPVSLYAATGLLLVVLTAWRPAAPTTQIGAQVTDAGRDVPRAAQAPGDAAATISAVVLGLVLLGAAAESLYGVLVLPWGWLTAAWSGHPAGVGLHPDRVGHVTIADTAAIALLVPAAALAAGRRAVAGAGRTGIGQAACWAAGAPLALVLPLALAAAGVPWPAVPAGSLLAGLAGLLAVAVRTPFGPGTGGFGATGTQGSGGGASWQDAGGLAVAGVGALLTGAGLAGALPTRWSALAALGAVLAVGAAAGAAGRHLAARLTGWLAAVTAGLAIAYTAGRTAGLPVAHTAFAVLGAAAAALALGVLLAGRRPTEGRAVQAAAHAGAVVALLNTAGSARYAAVVCLLWGVTVGLRALRAGETPTVRRAYVVAAAATELVGWWLLLRGQQVSIVEAYTLPAAAVAVLAGWLARRGLPGLSSWSAYAVALGAALLPTLAVVLTGDGQQVRRLLLGLGALGVVLVGAKARLQAPVVTGGIVLGLVAMHEAALVWDLVPRWIPLAAAGLLLVGLAMTLERRRRDLARLRAALHRMA